MSFTGRALPAVSLKATPISSVDTFPDWMFFDRIPMLLVSVSMSTPDCCAAKRRPDIAAAVPPVNRWRRSTSEPTDLNWLAAFTPNETAAATAVPAMAPFITPPNPAA